MYKKGQDFIGTHIGESEAQTKEILKKAKGKVLMIDEAYMLDPNRGRGSLGADPYRQGAIDTLVSEVQNTPDEDICVILAGYRDLMEEMIKNANPGLARRFPMADAFVFKEFDASQLERVLDKKLREDEFAITDEAKKVAMDMLQLSKQLENFGNGGEVDILLRQALANYRTRFSKMSPEQRKSAGKICFLPEDIDPDWNQVFRIGEKVEELFEGLVGIDDIRSRFISLTQRATSLREAGHDPAAFMPFHLAFKGPRGTGKTMVAGKMGWLFHSMRLIPTEEVVQKSVRDLMDIRAREKLGNGSSNSYRLMKESLGKILVIDDAHRLFGEDNEQGNMLVRQAREELIDALNHPEFSGKVVVILTGREKLGRTLDVHSGLGSKFSVRMQFRGPTSDDCLDLLQQELNAEGISVELNTDEETQIGRAFETLCRSNEWGHCRDIQLITSELVGSTFEQAVKADSSLTVNGPGILRCLRDKFPRQLTHLPDKSGAKLSTAGSSPSAGLSDRTIHASVGTQGDAGREVAKMDRVILKKREQEQVSASGGSIDFGFSSQKKISETYQYQTLPEGKYIRVLQLHPALGHNKPIECELQELFLDDQSDQQRHFDALSYVWGTGERTQQIICDGETLRVTRNCELGLRYLRRKDCPFTLWIDAICINQDPDAVAERNCQVSLMGEIYKTAVHVYIWLGEGTDGDAKALTKLQNLCCLGGDWGEHINIQKNLWHKYQSKCSPVPL